jgi:hypothetical protein
LDAFDMNGHNNVFLRNGIDAAVEEYEGDEEEEKDDDDDDDDEEDWSDDEFDDADFADV